MHFTYGKKDIKEIQLLNGLIDVETMNENDFKKDAAVYDNDQIAIDCLEKLKNKFLKGYNNTINSMADPFINTSESKRVEKVSFEFS